MDSKRLVAFTQRLWPHGSPMRFVHRFSDSGLHTTLMIAIVLLATLALVQAVRVGVSVWLLDPVVVQGHSQPPHR